MLTASECPDPLRWGDLLDSRLSERVASSLCSHLETCPGCQSTLDRLTAGDSTWVEAARTLDPRPRPALRRAMEQLKAEGEAGRDTVGPTAVGAATLPFLRPSINPDHIGRLGPYEVLGVVGRGGMGVVLKAFDSALRRLVAIKVLAPQWATHAQARQRFEREARAAALVRHENVVAIHAVEEADGLPYLVMEYVPGESLQQHLDRNGPLAVEDILRIGAQAAAGLAAAHKQDLVHRDVKPANILLDEGGNVRLTDFGLARAVDDSSLTQTGVIAGTPQYMAPEQARGAKVDHRADLFSLGSVLYAMCAGRPPFRATTTVAVLKRVCDEMPDDVREHNPDIPDWLVEIIDQLHAKRPRDRFWMADEVARLLMRHLRHLRSPDTVDKPGSLRRHRRLVAMAPWLALLAIPAAGVAALLVWAAVHVLFPNRPDDRSSQPTGPGPQVQGPREPRPQAPGPQAKAPPAPVPPIKGDEYFQKLWADLHDNNFFSRQRALERLANMEPNDQRAVVARKLVELADATEPQIRWLAIKALGVWGSENDVPVLLRAMADENPFTRRAALQVVGRFRDPRVLKPVIHGFRDFHTRKEGGQALRQLGPLAELEVLAILKEGDDAGLGSLKKDAIQVLADIGTDASVPALREAAASRNIRERQLVEPAQQALAAIDKRQKDLRR